MRPRDFKEFVGHHHLLGEGKPLTKLIDGGHLPSTILWGPPGTGKTTLAHLLAVAVGADFQQLSAVSSGVSDARRVMDHSKTTLFRTVLFVDEVHRWNKAQQEILLPAIEDGSVTLIGATTENPYHSLVGPLLSRCLLLRLEPLEPKEIRGLLEIAVDRLRAGDGRARRDPHGRCPRPSRGALRGRRPSGAHRPRGRGPAGRRRRDLIDGARVADAVQKRIVAYDRGDSHFDVVSAFIKSMRGSDPDAALFWLGRMIHAGEDPRFIVRRMVIFASEDVGLADPQALPVAVPPPTRSSTSACPRLASTSRRRPCTSPGRPSRTPSRTRWRRRWHDADSNDPVPAHLRDAHYAGAAKLGHGEGYEYPHDFEGHHVEQQYRPERFEDIVYYEPTGQGETSRSNPEPASPARGCDEDAGARRGLKRLRSHGYAGRTAHPTEPRR